MSRWVYLGDLAIRTSDVDYVEKSDFGCKISMTNGKMHWSDKSVAEVTEVLNEAEHAISMVNVKPSPSIASNSLLESLDKYLAHVKARKTDNKSNKPQVRTSPMTQEASSSAEVIIEDCNDNEE